MVMVKPNYQSNLFNFLYCLTGAVCWKLLSCWGKLSAANLVAFCKLLVVIDQTVTYSKSAFTLHPWDIKFTKTTHCLSKKTQAVPLPADAFLRAWWRHCFHCTNHHWHSGTWWWTHVSSHQHVTLTYCRQSVIDFSTFSKFCNKNLIIVSCYCQRSTPIVYFFIIIMTPQYDVINKTMVSDVHKWWYNILIILYFVRKL